VRPARGIDAALAAGAIAFAAPSLTYPFSRDQALYWYVGRAWLDGALPYRDVVEHKTPFVYAVHALCCAVLGDTTWGIRALEVVATLAIGWLAASLASPARGPVRSVVLGGAMLVASVFYYGYLPYQDQAHSEIWCILLALGAAVAARRASTHGRAALAAGVLLGLGFVAKPPVLAFVPMVALELRARGAPLRRSAWLAAAGFAAVLAAVVAYFAARGGLGDLVDVTVRANAAFAREGRGAGSLREWLGRLWKAMDWFLPWSWIFVGACAAGVARGRLRGDRRLAARYGAPLAWAACAYAAVFVQLKFHVYQHALFVAPCALLGGTLARDLSRLALALAPARARPRRGGALRCALAAAFAAAVVVSCVADTPGDVWLLRARNAMRRLRGELDAAALVDSFDDPRWLDMAAAHAVGAWVRAHAAPGEHLLVRSYDPEIYYFAGRMYGGRFFWSTVLGSPALAYRRQEWLAQDRADVERLRPAWVVTRRTSESGAELEAPEWFERMGWTRQTLEAETEARAGPFVVLYRPPGAGAIQ